MFFFFSFFSPQIFRVTGLAIPVFVYNLFFLSIRTRSVDTLMAYIEYLAQHLKSGKSLGNYVSGISFLHKCLRLPFNARQDPIVLLFLRAAKISLRAPKVKPTVSIRQLEILMQLASHLGSTGIILQVAMSWGFFGFLRQSNLAPIKVGNFNPLKHTTRGHVHQASPGLVVYLPWSKSNKSGDFQNVPLPALPQKHILCPVNAYNNLLKVAPTIYNKQPLLSLPGKTFTIRSEG